VIHYGKYHPITTEELDTLVEYYDDPEVHMGLTDTWQDKFAHTWIGSSRRGSVAAGQRGQKPDGRVVRSGGFLE
jgi:hypothetical protein